MKGGGKMSAEEKLINAVREGLLDKHGEDFAMLPPEQQNEWIALMIQEYIEQMRKEKRQRPKG